jgi:hypothetical protein
MSSIIIDSITPNIRAINLSMRHGRLPVPSIGVGNVQTFASSGIGTLASSMAVHPSTGEVHLSDATPNVNRFSVPGVSGQLRAPIRLLWQALVRSNQGRETSHSGPATDSAADSGERRPLTVTSYSSPIPVIGAGD